MIKTLRCLLYCVLFFLPGQLLAQTLVAGWDFQTTTNGGTAGAAAPNSPLVYNSNFGTGAIYLDGTNGSSAWIAATTGNQVTSFGGTSVNAGTGFGTTTATGTCLAIVNQTANGNFIVFKFSMSGFKNLVASYATQRTGTGFSSHVWEYSTDGTTWNAVTTLSTLPAAFATQTLTTITGLDNSATAYLRLTVAGATAAAGNNRIDNIQFKATAATAPANTATYPKINNITSTTLDLISNLDAAGTTYYDVIPATGTVPTTVAQVKAGQDGNNAAALASGSFAVSAANTDATKTIAGLTASTAYKVYVVSQDGSGNLQTSFSTLSATTLVATPAPIVTTGTVTVKTSTTVTLPGNINDNGATTTATFDYGTAADLTGSSSANATPNTITTGTGATAVSANVTTLAPNTPYYYRAKGVSSAGTTTGSILSFTTPPAATVLTAATAVTANGFKINWGAVTGATSYQLDVSTTNDFSAIITGYNNLTVSSGTSQVVTGLTGNTPYYYRVRAVGTGGTGDNSTTGTQTTSVAVPALASTVTTLNFNNVVMGNTYVETFKVSGSNLSSDVTITTLAPFSLSKDGTTFSTSITYTVAELATAQTVSVQFLPVATGSFTGNVTITSTGATPVGVTLSGTGVSATIAGNHVVLSEVYGGGGNANAPYTNDFIELYNPTGSDVNLSGASVQYGSSGGTTWSAVDLTGVIKSHGFYLVQLASGGAVGSALPTADDSGNINMAAAAGKVALVNSINLLTGDNPTSASIVDLLGFGSGTNGSETSPVLVTGSPAPTSNTFSFERKANANSTAATLQAGGIDALAGNAYDTDNNSTDFVVQTTPGPQNSSSPLEPIVAGIPTLTANPTSLDFGTTQTVGTPSTSKTFTLSGTNLTAGVSLATAAPYSISTDGTNFSTSATITAAALATAQTISVRFTPANSTAAIGNIAITSIGATQVNVGLTGTGAVVVTTPTLTANPTSLDFGTTQTINTPSASKTFTLSGASLTAGASLVTAAPYSISTDGTNFSTSTTITAATLATAQTISVRFTPANTTAAIGNIAITSTGATPVNVGLTGTGAAVAQGTEHITFNTITAKTYGNADFAPGATSDNTATPVTYSSDNAAVATIINGNIHIVSAGTANITASQAADATHSAAANVIQALTVNKAALTITANNQTKAFGAANPVLTLAYAGFVNGDTQANLTTQPVATTTATTTSAPGNYPITASGAASNNYMFTYVQGTLKIGGLSNANLSNLTISTGTLTPTFAATTTNYTVTIPITITSVTVIPTFDPTASATINGTPVPNSSPSFNISINLGTTAIPIVVTAQDGITKVTYTITVTQGSATAPVTATNILSPNGDGKNDTWVVKDIQLYPNNIVTIYDRGGRIVYTKKGYNNDWAGTVNNAPLTQGTYFYIINLDPAIQPIKGFVTIIESKN